DVFWSSLVGTNKGIKKSGVAECRYKAIAGTSKARFKFLEIIPKFSNAWRCAVRALRKPMIDGSQ
ncbi:hypothetical protein, partial [Funiculus sociatus]|uniref:hypothetical protein n=1 Tax=Funiculus sociatus TaxID=450527 RepID=UPI00329A5065